MGKYFSLYMCIAGKDSPQNTCRSTKGGSTKYWLRGVNTFAHHTFVFFICKNVLKPRIIFFPLHNYAPPCIGFHIKSHSFTFMLVVVTWQNVEKFKGVQHTTAFKGRQWLVNHCQLCQSLTWRCSPEPSAPLSLSRSHTSTTLTSTLPNPHTILLHSPTDEHMVFSCWFGWCVLQHKASKCWFVFSFKGKTWTWTHLLIVRQSIMQHWEIIWKVWYYPVIVLYCSVGNSVICSLSSRPEKQILKYCCNI